MTMPYDPQRQLTVRLTAEQLLALDVLVAGGSDHDAAATAGVEPCIIEFWRRLVPEFQHELHRRRRLLRGGSAGLIAELDALEQKPDRPGRRVLNAARALLDRIKTGYLPAQFGLRDVYRPGWARLTQRALAQAAVDLLLEIDAIRGMVIHTTGRRAKRYLANRQIWEDVVLH
jgi:hypothetical protein